jgi:PAS domain S-box-containing protein
MRHILENPLLGFGLALAALVANALLSAANIRDLVRSDDYVFQTRDILDHLDAAVGAVGQAESSQRAYLLIGKEELLHAYQGSAREVQDHLGQLDRLADANEPLAARLPELKRLLGEQLDVLREAVTIRQKQGPAAGAVAALTRGGHSAAGVRRLTGEIRAEEGVLLRRRMAERQSGVWRAFATSIAASLLVLALLGASYYLVRRGIAERERSEETMRLREGALRAISQGIFITDPSRQDEPISYVNAAFQRLTGYSQREAKGRDIAFLVGPDTEPAAVAELRAAYAAGRDAAVEMRCYRKDGSAFWTSLAVSPVRDAGGHVTHFIGVMTDVTERRRSEEQLRDSEERLRLMIESVKDYAILSLDVEGRVASWNKGAERLFGHGEGEIVGRSAAALFTPEDQEAGVPEQELAAARRTGRAEDDRWHQRQDGSRFYATGTVTPVRDAAGMLRGYTKIARDMTERKRAEEELWAAKEAAEAANRAKSTFLANMSHELRTPLNAVILYSELLQEEAQDAGVEGFIPDLEKIRAAGKHLLALVNGVLDLSKIEAGRMELYLETFDVAQMVEEVVSTLRPVVEKRGNAFEVRVAPELGAMTADLTKVRQVLFNLISNAAKFTEKGTVTLAADREKAAAGERVLFRVRDTGIGMTPAQVGQLFRPFAQGDASTTRKYGGTGLGLVIARRFCEMMGGDLTVTSAPGQGSVFTASLPVDAGPEEDRSVQPALADGAAQGVPTVLVIDDEAGVRELLTRFLKSEGFRVVTAGGGKEGLRLARQLRPTAILLDVIMPGMDGWSVLTNLKGDARVADIPVILLTMLDDRNMGYMLGASEFLTKPIDAQQLTTVLEKYRRARTAAPLLIIEDDLTTRQVLRRALTRQGWAVAEADNGRAGLERVAADRPQLILLDLLMPEMDGFDFLAELRQNEEWRSIPVVVLTAKDLTPEERAFLQGHVERILQKGAHSREELLREVRQVVARYAGRSAPAEAAPAP